MPRVRVQPAEVEIPEDNPFENDHLDRREAISTLTNIVSNVEGPCILSIDAPWGAGKTTFLKMWKAYLRKREFTVVYFNAWESDFLEEPFVALSSEIIRELKKDDNAKTLVEEVEALAVQAKQVIIQSLPTLTGSLAAGLPLVGPLAGAAVEAAAEWIMSSHQNTKHYIHEFNGQLKQLAKKLSDENNDRPLIVIIDELDRCRPLYAIELLETTKHIFNVDNVIFALSTNRQQMAASVKAIYGDQFCGEKYLERFFDIYFSLPEVDRQKFITSTLDSVGIEQGFRNPYFKSALVALLNATGLSLREVAKAIHHLRLVSASFGPRAQMEIDIAAMLMIHRALDRSWYNDLIEGVANDTEFREKFEDAIPARNREIMSTTEYAVYETILQAINMQRRGEESGAESLVNLLLIEKKIRPGEELPLRQTLEHYAHAIIYGLKANSLIDVDGIVRKIELTSEDRNAA